MKHTLIALSLFLTLNAFADIEFSSESSAKATSEEIAKNRACFEELKQNGCGDPGEDIKHFRSCLSNVHENLSNSCKTMMSNLYGTK